MYIGGLDIGTTGCKIVLYDENGNQKKSAYREYNVSRSGGFHEINIDAIYAAVTEVLSEISDYDTGAVGVTSFGETFVMLDEGDMPLYPSMLYTDPRGGEECAELAKHFGADKLALQTGTMPHEMYSVSKIMWIKKHMPEKFAMAKRILLIQDYIVYKLTGVCQIDYSLAARTGMLDIKKKCWIDEILDYCGIDKSLLSKPVPSGTAAGIIKTEIAQKTGISEKTVIVSGCQDQIAALTGANVFENGQAMDGIGTVECVPIVMDKIPEECSIYKYGYSVVPHINGKYACYILSYAGGATLKWFRDNFSDLSYAEMDKTVLNDPTDLLIMPHFAGAATPYMDTASKAAVVGLTFEHTKEDIYKALMEGTSYEILLNMYKMREFGVELKGVTATGGGASSDVWLGIKADIFGIPVAALDSSETGAAGTAYLAGKAIGVYSDDTTLLNERKVFYPDSQRNKYYKKQFKRYAKIYEFSKGVLNDE